MAWAGADFVGEMHRQTPRGIRLKDMSISEQTRAAQRSGGDLA